MKISNKKLHIIIIVVGIIFICLGAIHTNLWFDESYSVGMANHNFDEIWTIGSHDVHPVLYYWILRITAILTGGGILTYRLVSIVPLAILGILGFTHIKKDFGEKVGLIFSFLVFFLPVNVIYATEIRMYTWAMLFVSVMAIYAYRIIKDGNIKNWTIFAIFSLASAYTHYYGLMAAGIINVALFIYFIVKAIKAKENKKEYIHSLIKFFIQAVIQIALYVPWLFAFFAQFNSVSNGFWIQQVSFETILEIFVFQFTGNMFGAENIEPLLAVSFIIILLIYLVTLERKYKKENSKYNIKPAVIAIGIYMAVLIAAIIISIVKAPILYSRYMLNVTGLFIFFIAYIMSKEKNHYRTIAICSLIVIVAMFVNLKCISENYEKNNMEVDKFISEKIKEDDIIIYGNNQGGFGSGFVISVKYKDNKQYFYDKENWNVEEAYKAFAPAMEIVYNLDCLKDYTGRIWIIGADNFEILDKEFQNAGYDDDIKILEKAQFNTGYKSYQYSIALVQKNS